MSLEYVPGEWTGLATETGVVLLAPTVPSATVRAVWDALAAGRPITQWLEIIAGGGISSLPAFALVERTADGVRVLLRGDVVVDVDGTEVAARGMSTWREVLVEAATDIVVRTPGAVGTAGPVDDSWPLVGGVVRAARIRVDLADAAPAEPAAGAGASAEASAAPAEAPAAGVDAPASSVDVPAAPEAAPVLPIGALAPMADADVPTPAADAVDEAVAGVPEHADDESVSMAEPVDVFEEAGFGVAADVADAGADDGVDELVDAEPDDAAASTEAPVPAFGVDASAEEPVPAFGVDVSAGARESAAEADDVAADEPVPAFGVDASPEAAVPPFGMDTSAEAAVPAFGVDAAAESPVPEFGLGKHAAAEPEGPALADDEDASAQPLSPSDGDVDDLAHHETYVGPLPDIATPGAEEPEQEQPDEPTASDADADADADADTEADAPVADAYVAGGQGDGESPVPPRPPEGTPTAEYEQVGPVSSGLIDSLPWNMPNARAADAQPAAPSPVPAFDPPAVHTSVPTAATGAGDAEIEGDHDGETILVSHLRTAYAQDAADAVPNQPPSATIVPGVADDALYDEPGPVIMLAVSSGPRVPLDRVVLIGRAPESSRFAGALMPRLVTVPSPQQDISRTHVEVRLEGDHVVVTDLRSTNGTMVAVPGNDPRRLHPGEGVPVPVGSLIDLGDGITIGVESSGSPHGQGH
ncbi:FHA domain-containing protein [Occultella gossypii]|uniref:FHA domain-containing protein n=1 Tax=Occultella gossypii TaxID=2800820 RepID=A0ABS7S4F2_9MICO|nr:FHA domain-containing protein [Occultella gossypii]MBZ2195229.1 FHA domain-containing protein [Occultella gossypii]